MQAYAVKATLRVAYGQPDGGTLRVRGRHAGMVLTAAKRSQFSLIPPRTLPVSSGVSCEAAGVENPLIHKRHLRLARLLQCLTLTGTSDYTGDSRCLHPVFQMVGKGNNVALCPSLPAILRVQSVGAVPPNFWAFQDDFFRDQRLKRTVEVRFFQTYSWP